MDLLIEKKQEIIRKLILNQHNILFYIEHFCLLSNIQFPAEIVKTF